MKTGTWINKSAAARITGKSVLSIRVMPNGAVCVVYKVRGAKGCTLVSRKTFLTDALRLRKNFNRQDYRVLKYATGGFQGFYDVHFAGSTDHHRVILRGRHSICNCQDWQHQKSEGNGFSSLPFCKHLGATVAHLGFGSFAEYCQDFDIAWSAELASV